MINRKIERDLLGFLERGSREALLISGARQVGKTFIVREFGRKNFKHYIEINFVKNPKARTLFADTVTEDEFFTLLTAFTSEPIVSGETLIFFDEVQECPEIVTFIKFLVDDGRCRYILSGSLLGIELKDVRSAPVGYLREIKMYPLDFREFAEACGVSDDMIALVKAKCEAGYEVPYSAHDRLMKLLRLYLVVGGMPKAVQAYIDTHDIREVVIEQKAIIVEYKHDASKYDEKEKMRIVRTLELVPSELNRQNKRFFVTDLKHREKFERLEENFVWLDKAGIAIPVYNVDSPTVPLELAKKANLFKLFMNDVGLLACQYAEGIQLEILSGNMAVNFGSVFENFVAQELRAAGYETLYYFNSKKVGEIDFLIERRGKVLPIEVKSGKAYKNHTALDNLMAVRDFAIESAMILDVDATVERGRISYLPVYSTMFMEHDPLSQKLIYEL